MPELICNYISSPPISQAHIKKKKKNFTYERIQNISSIGYVRAFHSLIYYFTLYLKSQTSSPFARVFVRTSSAPIISAMT